MTLSLVPPLDDLKLDKHRVSLELVHVGAGCECGHYTEAPAPLSEQFCYTVGLSEFDHPELLVRGMCATDSADLLHRWGCVVIEGDRFLHGDLLCEGPGGSRWEVVEVAHPQEVLLWANDRYQVGPKQLSALEIVPSTRSCRNPDCR